MDIEENVIKVVKKHHRKLDALSKLLACGSGSVCVAASIFNGQLIIAANEFFVGTKNETGNQKLKAMKEILNYFQKVINKSQTQEDLDPHKRQEIFKLICRGDKSSIVEPPYSYKLGDENFKKLCGFVISQTPITPVSCKKEFGKAWKVAWDAYGSFNNLLGKLTKVETWLKEMDLTERPSSLEILTKELQSGVHAEMQILAETVRRMGPDPERAMEVADDIQSKRKLLVDLDIGISKLCCLHCGRMLEAANEVLTERMLGRIAYGGGHNYEFEDNWLMPHEFFTEKDKEIYKDDEIDYWSEQGKLSEEFSETFSEIKKEIKEEITKMKEEEKKAKKAAKEAAEKGIEVEEVKIKKKQYTYQSPSPSSSEGSPLPMGIDLYGNTPVHILLNLRGNLEEHFENSEIDRILPIILKLIEIKEFSDHFQGISLESDAQADFRSILKTMQVTVPKISEEELLKIMQNKNLVGEKVAKHFSAIGREQKEEKKAKITTKRKSEEDSTDYSHYSSSESQTGTPMLSQYGGEKKKQKQLKQTSKEAELKPEDKPEEPVPLTPQQEKKLGLPSRPHKEPTVDPSHIPKDAGSVFTLKKGKKK